LQAGHLAWLVNKKPALD